LPTVTLLGLNVTSKAKAQSAALNFIVQSVKAGAADILHFTLTITIGILGALASSFRQVGIGIDFDKGDGVLTRLLGSEIGSQITLSGNLDSFGRTLSFSRRGLENSPLLYSVIRGLRHVKMTGYLGVPGSVKSLTMFDGYLRQGSYNDHPSSADIQCQDASLKWASVKLSYNLAPGSLKTRLQILLDIFTAYNVPYGTLDLGPSDGGVVFKGISVGGDVSLFEWIRGFLTPTGRRMYFRPDGKIEIKRFDTTGPVQRTLKAVDIGSLQVTPPATDDPNSVSITSTQFGYIGPIGTRTEVTDVATPGNYTPVAAINKQDYTTGFVSALALSPAAATIVRRVRTTTIYSGGTIVAQIVEEWGYYSARACKNQQDGSGNVSYNSSFDVYQFPDGSWRMNATEIFQKIRETRTQRTFDTGTGVLVSESKVVGRFTALEFPITIFSTTSVESSIACFLTEDGHRWWAGQEIIEFALPPNIYGDTAITSRYADGLEITNTTFGADGNNRITAQILITYAESLYSFILTSKPTGTIPAATYYGFGPSNAKRYAVAVASGTLASAGGPYVVISYTPIDESSYKRTVSVQWATSPNIQGDLLEAWNTLPTSGTFSGAIPVLDVLTAKQTPQPRTQVVTDNVRVALVGQTIPDYQSNDFCEDAGELRTAALEELRMKSAFRVPIQMPFDPTFNEGDVIQVQIPRTTGEPKKCLVWGISRTFTSNGDARQSVDALFYPDELIAA
jgi:hypothetical protein